MKKDSIHFGAILSLSDPSGPVYEGIEVRDGMMLALNEINEWGGINGKPINLIIQNSHINTKSAIDAFLTIEEKYNPIVYITTFNSISIALAHYTRKNNALQFGLVVTAPSYTNNFDHAYRFWPMVQDELPVLLRLFNSLEIRKIGVLYIDDEYGRALYSRLEEEFSDKGGIVKGAAFQFFDNDITHLLKGFQGVDAIYSVGFPFQLSFILEQINESGFSGHIISTDALALPNLRSNKKIDNTYFICPLVYNKKFIYAKDVKEKYEKKYNKQFNHYAASGYDVVKIIAGLLEGNNTTLKGLKHELKKGFTYTGCFGIVTLERGKRDLSFSLYPAKIENGQIEFMDY
jgi:branched-chain amino acid transport system substrate-binding protein